MNRPFEAKEYFDAVDSIGRLNPKTRKRFLIYTNLLAKLGKIDTPKKNTFSITEKGRADLQKKR
ncbi:MAG TPA: hypothetical protein ENN75_04465 [candidate division Zixibacteria bacterium]|nr:hypothetical protein [candidate division Zixibacteria bacterium]